jgi:hypothetical protein
MFSPYSPAFAKDVGTSSPAVFDPLAKPGVSAEVLLAGGALRMLFDELDEHPLHPITKRATTTAAARATAFHLSRGCVVLAVEFIWLLPPRFSNRFRVIECLLDEKFQRVFTQPNPERAAPEICAPQAYVIARSL